MTISYKAAWVPDLDDIDWDTAAELAVEWTEAVAAERGVSAMLVTSAQGAGAGVSALRSFEARHPHTTPRSQNHRGVRGSGSVVFAYCPDPAAMELAISLAHNSALAVVEGFSLPLRGWARATQAVNLFDPEASKASDEDEFTKLVDRIVFYGNNGFTRGFGHDQAQRILTDYKRAGGDLTDVASAVFAHGVSWKGYKRLTEMIEKIPGGTARGYSSRDW